MINKDFKRLNLFISSSLTAVFEAGINQIDRPSFRQVLSPLAILVAYFISISVIHIIKNLAKSLQIKNLEEEIAFWGNNQNKVEECKAEIIKLKRERSKLDLFF